MENGMEMEWKIFAHDRWNGKELEWKVEWKGMEHIIMWGLEN